MQVRVPCWFTILFWALTKKEKGILFWNTVTSWAVQLGQLGYDSPKASHLVMTPFTHAQTFDHCVQHGKPWIWISIQINGLKCLKTSILENFTHKPKLNSRISRIWHLWACLELWHTCWRREWNPSRSAALFVSVKISALLWAPQYTCDEEEQQM